MPNKLAVCPKIPLGLFLVGIVVFGQWGQAVGFHDKPKVSVSVGRKSVLVRDPDAEANNQLHLSNGGQFRGRDGATDWNIQNHCPIALRVERERIRTNEVIGLICEVLKRGVQYFYPRFPAAIIGRDYSFIPEFHLHPRNVVVADVTRGASMWLCCDYRSLTFHVHRELPIHYLALGLESDEGTPSNKGSNSGSNDVSQIKGISPVKRFRNYIYPVNPVIRFGLLCVFLGIGGFFTHWGALGSRRRYRWTAIPAIILGFCCGFAIFYDWLFRLWGR